MNLVGKILVWAVLVMSVAFMGMATAVYTTHKSWVDVVNRPREKSSALAPLGLKYQLEDAKKATTDLQAKYDAYQTEMNAEKDQRAKSIAALEQKKADLEKENADLKTQIATLKDETAKQLALLTTTQDTLTKKQAQIDSLRTDITTAQTERDERLKEAVTANDKMNIAEGELARAKETSRRLGEQMAQAKIVLERHGLKPEAAGGPPKVDGIVLAADRHGLVEISLGSDDGIERGNTLEVYRLPHSYLGRIEVLQTEPDRSVAKVIPGYQKGKIEREDRVATRLN
jgi:hypothetical protein